MFRRQPKPELVSVSCESCAPKTTTGAHGSQFTFALFSRLFRGSPWTPVDVLAEGVGFEPTEAQKTSTVFETVPFVRSGSLPPLRLAGNFLSGISARISLWHFDVATNLPSRLIAFRNDRFVWIRSKRAELGTTTQCLRGPITHSSYVCRWCESLPLAIVLDEVISVVGGLNDALLASVNGFAVARSANMTNFLSSDVVDVVAGPSGRTVPTQRAQLRVGSHRGRCSARLGRFQPCV